MGRTSRSVLSNDEQLHEHLSESLPDTATSEGTTSASLSGPLTFAQPSPETRWPSEPSPSDSLSAGGGDDDSPGPSLTSSAVSSGSGKPVASKAALKRAAREGVALAGTAAHELGARDELAREAGVWLTDEEDQRSIGDPLGSMAGRRSMLSSAANPDVVDAIAAGVGLVVYLGKQLGRLRAVKAARAERAAAAATIPDTDAGEDLTAVHVGPAPDSDPAATSWT